MTHAEAGRLGRLAPLVMNTEFHYAGAEIRKKFALRRQRRVLSVQKYRKKTKTART